MSDYGCTECGKWCSEPGHINYYPTTLPFGHSETIRLRTEVAALKAENEKLKAAANCYLHQETIEKLKADLSALVLKFGGKNAGHAYGLTNCAACGELDNDYYLVGKSQLCMDCWDEFPLSLVKFKSQLAAARETLEKLAVDEYTTGCDCSDVARETLSKLKGEG